MKVSQTQVQLPVPTSKIQFKQGVFYVLLDYMIGNLTQRFNTLNAVKVKFEFS